MSAIKKGQLSDKDTPCVQRECSKVNTKSKKQFCHKTVVFYTLLLQHEPPVNDNLLNVILTLLHFSFHI